MNPELRELMGLPARRRVWHSVRVAQLKDGVTLKPSYVVSQVWLRGGDRSAMHARPTPVCVAVGGDGLGRRSSPELLGVSGMVIVGGWG